MNRTPWREVICDDVILPKLVHQRLVEYSVLVHDTYSSMVTQRYVSTCATHSRLHKKRVLRGLVLHQPSTI